MKKNVYEIYYTDENQIAAFEFALAYMNRTCVLGQQRSITLDVDGDGSAAMLACKDGKPLAVMMGENGQVLIPLEPKSVNGWDRERIGQIDANGDLTVSIGE